MKTAGIRELKARLSDYIRQAQSGETILITDRGLVVAEMRNPQSSQDTVSVANSRFRQAVQSGLVQPSVFTSEQKRELLDRIRKGIPGTRLSKGSAARILDELREEK